MGKDAPDAPDYEAAAERTAEGNLQLLDQQTRANRPTQITPWGTSSWVEEGDGNWTQRIELTPEQQNALQSQLNVGQYRSNLAENMLERVGQEFGDVMDWGQFDEYAKDLGTGDEARQEAIDASYGQATSRLDRRFGNRREQAEAALRNQGLRPGDEAYDNAMMDLGEVENDAYNQAMYSAIREGGAEGSRVFGMNRDSAAFGNQVRQAQIAEEMQRRGFTLNEINSILTGQQIGMPSMPGFNQAGRGQGADYTGAARDAYGAELDAFNADNAFLNSLMGGAGSAASAYFLGG